MTSVATPGRIVPADRLRGRLVMPADKSIAHRALIVNALSGGPATVEVRSPGADVLSTAACLRALGVRIEEEHLGPVVRFSISGTPGGDARLDCGNSGTTMRLLAGALAGLPVRATLDGDASLQGRPMERVAQLLRAEGQGPAALDLLGQNVEWYAHAGGGDGALLSTCILVAETRDAPALASVLAAARRTHDVPVQIHALDAQAHHAALAARPAVAFGLLGQADDEAARSPTAVPERERHDKRRALSLLVASAR